MSDLPELPDAATAAEQIGNAIEVVSDAVETAVTGLPAPIRKNFTKALARLTTSLMNLPATYLEGKVKEMKAETNARVMLTEAAAKQMASELKVTPDFVEAAAYTHAKKIVRGKINSVKVVEQSVNELKRLPAPDANHSVEDISDDWLNAFEEEAANMSSEHMQRLFGKILAREINKPKTYSIRTIKLMSQLDNSAAELFTRFCSMACILEQGPGQVFDARVVALGNASQNSLISYGLSFGALNILQEYGLVAGDLNAQMPYSGSIKMNNILRHTFTHQGQHWYLVPKVQLDVLPAYPMHGPQLTQSGRELLPIVDIEPTPEYTKALENFIGSQSMTMTKE